MIIIIVIFIIFITNGIITPITIPLAHIQIKRLEY
jgi:hypothetical protein